MRFCSLLLASALLILPRPSAAQTPARTSVSGVVLDARTRSPIRGATITSADVRAVAITASDGRFVLSDVPTTNLTISARRLGYAAVQLTVRVPATGISDIELLMSAAPYSLDAVVSTATGDQRRLVVGNAITTIDVDSITRTAPITSITDVLNGRVAGVQIQTLSGLTGAGPRIRMRGLSSISLTNDPIVYLDGVRIESSPASVAGGGVGGPAPNRLNDINPDEIESIDIVRGPSAATLYGTDAANGVVLIRTKRGLAGAPKWRTYVEGGAITQPTDRYPTAYYQWGHTPTVAATQCLLLTQATGGCVPDSLSAINVLRNSSSTPFGTGQRWQVGAQVGGGTESLRYFLSAERELEVGTFTLADSERTRISLERGGAAIPYEQLHPNVLERTSLRTNLAASLSKQADISVSAGYVGSNVSLPPDGGTLYGPIYAGVNGRGYADQFGGWATYRPGDSFGQQWQQTLNRFTLSSTLNARPLSWLTGRLTTGLDYVSRVEDLLQRRDEGPNLATFRNGRKEVTRAGQALYTVDASAVALHAIASGIVTRMTIGAQYTRNNARQTRATASDLGPGGSTLDAGATRSSTELTTQFATLGAYVEQGLEFGDRLFVAAALRGDDNSSFGRDYNAALYPKVSGSWVLSREGLFERLNALDMLRVRVAYGQSGVQPGTRDALFAYRAFTATVGGRDVNAVEVSTAGNPDLKPERTAELEFGFDAALAGQRVRTEVTWYSRTSKDALISLPLPTAVGVLTSRLENLGAVRNRGGEARVDAVLINRRALTLSAYASGSINQNRILSLGEGVAPIVGPFYRQVVGYPINSEWVRPILGYSDTNGNGIIEVSEVQVGDTAVYRGTTQPTREATYGAEVGLLSGRLRVSAQLDQRGGNRFRNRTSSARCTAAAPNCLEVNSKSASLFQQARAVVVGSTVFGRSEDGYLENGAFTRLREVSATLDFGRNVASSIGAQNVSFTLSARNVALWTKYSGIDPEISGTAATGTIVEDNPSTGLSRYIIGRFNITF